MKLDGCFAFLTPFNNWWVSNTENDQTNRYWKFEHNYLGRFYGVSNILKFNMTWYHSNIDNLISVYDYFSI